MMPERHDERIVETAIEACQGENSILMIMDQKRSLGTPAASQIARSSKPLNFLFGTTGLGFRSSRRLCNRSPLHSNRSNSRFAFSDGKVIQMFATGYHSQFDAVHCAHPR